MSGWEAAKATIPQPPAAPAASFSFEGLPPSASRRSRTRRSWSSVSTRCFSNARERRSSPAIFGAARSCASACSSIECSVGQVLDDLLIAVAIPLAGADARLEIIEPSRRRCRPRAAGSRHRVPRAGPRAALPAPRCQLRRGSQPSSSRARSEDIIGTFSAMSSQPGGVGCRRIRQLRSARRRHQAGRHREAAHADPLRQLATAERGLRGDVEGALDVCQDSTQVGLPDVVGVDRLEAQALDPRQGEQKAAAQDEVGQEGADEEAADLGRGLVLEDQRGTETHDPRLGVGRLRSDPARAPPRPCGASRKRWWCPPWASSRRPRGPWGHASRRRPRRRGPASARPAAATASKTRRLPSTLIRSSVRASREGWIAQARWMTASAPLKIASRSALRMFASSQLVFGGVQVGSRRARPTI